jgi:hypothetical protein
MEVVRRVLSTIPYPSSDFDDDADSASCRHQGVDATISSTTSLSGKSAHPLPPPYFDVTKTMLHSQYAGFLHICHYYGWHSLENHS